MTADPSGTPAASGAPTGPGTLVAPGVHRLGDRAVSFYLVEDPAGLLLVDAGLPGHHAALASRLAALGATTADLRAVLLTHGHPDHTGLAARLRAEAGTEILVHAADAPILRDGPRSALKHARPARSAVPYLLRRPAAIRAPLHMARQGAFTAPPVAEVTALDGDGAHAGLPGRPRAVALPGHTPGSVAYLFPGRGLLFTGDALVTHDGLTGVHGPGLVCRGFTHDGPAALASLDRLAALPPSLLLPGHGEPFAGGPHAAADHARAAGLR